MQLAIFLLLIVLVLSSVLVIFNYWVPQNQLPQPSPSAFAPTEWMNFLPAEITGFRFYNMSTLARIGGLFQNPVILNLTALAMNITIYDVRYSLDIQDSNGSVINVMGINQTYAEAVSSVLANSSHERHEYHGTTIYVVPKVGQNETAPYWVCIDRGAIIVSSGLDPDYAALKSVVDATATTFFSNDTLKIGYLMTSRTKDNFVFTYYTAGVNNTYDIDWLMGGASNSTQLDVRVSYHFQTPQDLNNNYGNFTKTFLSDARAVYTSVNFIIGDYAYAQSNIGQVLMSL